MLLLGLAIQIKYTLVFEGLALGLLWLWCMGLCASWYAHNVLSRAVLRVACAVAPRAAAWLTYAAISYGEAFTYANFLSTLDKHAEIGCRACSRITNGRKFMRLAIMRFWCPPSSCEQMPPKR